MSVSDPRFRVAAARRILHRTGCDSGIAGQVSERASDGDAFWTSPFGYFDETTPHDVQKMDFDLNIIPGGNTELESSPAVDFHASIYRCRPEVGAVIHIHSLWSTIICTRQQEIGIYNDQATLLHDEQAFYVGRAIGGDATAEALGQKSVLLMRNHGLVVAAPSLEEATVVALVCEIQARVTVESEKIGGTEHTAEEAARMKKLYRHYHVPLMWRANVRRLRVSDPDLFAWVIDEELRRFGYIDTGDAHVGDPSS